MKEDSQRKADTGASETLGHPVSPAPVEHSLFKRLSCNKWHGCPEGIAQPCVFVFDRAFYRTPTLEQLARYRRSRAIVERLGGTMNTREFQIGGETEPLTSQEVYDILAAVRTANPRAEIITHWNGEGCYTMSVAVDLAPEACQSKGRTDA